jgi:hypothetical protein
MQQFKLVAGLQTMYFMLLAADSWPGAQLIEREGNPPVHDILDRLGLLKFEHDDGVELDVDSDNSDRLSSVKEIAGSPQRLQHETESPPNSCSRDTPASPQRVNLQQHISSQVRDSNPRVDSLNSQTMQSRSNLHQSLELPAEFTLKPPARMTAALPSTNPPDQILQATDWSAIDCMSPWWQDVPGPLQEPSYSDLNLTQAMPTAYSVTDVFNPESQSRNPYLTDPGVYMCDYDV